MNMLLASVDSDEAVNVKISGNLLRHKNRYDFMSIFVLGY